MQSELKKTISTAILSFIKNGCLILLTFLLGGTHLSAQNCDSTSEPTSTFCATIDSNDAFIHISWHLDAGCFFDLGSNPYDEGVFLELKADNQAIRQKL